MVGSTSGCRCLYQPRPVRCVSASTGSHQQRLIYTVGSAKSCPQRWCTIVDTCQFAGGRLRLSISSLRLITIALRVKNGCVRGFVNRPSRERCARRLPAWSKRSPQRVSRPHPWRHVAARDHEARGLTAKTRQPACYYICTVERTTRQASRVKMGPFGADMWRGDLRVYSM